MSSYSSNLTSLRLCFFFGRVIFLFNSFSRCSLRISFATIPFLYNLKERILIGGHSRIVAGITIFFPFVIEFAVLSKTVREVIPALYPIKPFKPFDVCEEIASQFTLGKNLLALFLGQN